MSSFVAQDFTFVPVPSELFSFPFVQKVAFQIVARCFSLCWNSRASKYEPHLTTMGELAANCGIGRRTLYDNWKPVLDSGFVVAERMGHDTLVLSVSEKFGEQPPLMAHRVDDGARTTVREPHHGGLSLSSCIRDQDSSSKTRTSPVVRFPHICGIDSPQRIEDLLVGFGVRLWVARTLSERPGMTYVDTLRLIKDNQKRNLGPGALVLRILNGDAIPGICEDCGNALVGTFNDWCTTCSTRQREGYLEYATETVDGEDEPD